DREEPPPPPAEVELEVEPTWWDLTAKILLYLLLGGLVVLGLLWQVGFFDAPRRSSPPPLRRGPQGQMKPGNTPQTRASLTVYNPEPGVGDQGVQRSVFSVQRSEAVPLSPPLSLSPGGGVGAQDSVGPSDGPAEDRPASGVRSVSPQTGHRFAVQAGAFKDKQRAARLVQRLRKVGYDARTLPVEARTSDALTRVVIVGFDSPQAAGGKAHRLRRSGLVPRAAVVDLGETPDSTGATWASMDNEEIAPAAAPR
ncbi:SPOR domain-containing protein, partial [bacterium]|nr:SPOR domain-containing protein [bacterium]